MFTYYICLKMLVFNAPKFPTRISSPAAKEICHADNSYYFTSTYYKHWRETFLNYLKVGLFYWKWHQESRFADTKSSIVYKHFVTPPHLQLAEIICLKINAIALPHCPEAQISNSRKQMDTDRSVDTWIPFPYSSWELNRVAPFYGLPVKCRQKIVIENHG